MQQDSQQQLSLQLHKQSITPRSTWLWVPSIYQSVCNKPRQTPQGSVSLEIISVQYPLQVSPAFLEYCCWPHLQSLFPFCYSVSYGSLARLLSLWTLFLLPIFTCCRRSHDLIIWLSELHVETLSCIKPFGRTLLPIFHYFRPIISFTDWALVTFQHQKFRIHFLYLTFPYSPQCWIIIFHFWLVNVLF